MTDAISPKAWRQWLLEPTPEHAQKWALCHARAAGPLQGTTLLREAVLAPGVAETLGLACKTYLATPLLSTAAEDLARLTECHYWLLDPKPGPRIMSEIRRFYDEVVQRKLETGVEVEAKLDLEVCKPQTLLLERAERAEKWSGELVRQVNELTRAGEARVLQAKIDGQETNYDIVKAENERLSALLRGREPPPRKPARKRKVAK